jgi:hypothetical protein
MQDVNRPTSSVRSGIPVVGPTMFTVRTIEVDGHRMSVLRPSALAFTCAARACDVLPAQFIDFCCGLRAELAQSPTDRWPCVIVDMQDVTFVDEPGSGALFACNKQSARISFWRSSP